MQKVSKIIYVVSGVLLVIFDVICLLVAFLQYQTLKTFGNHLSPDGDLRAFTPKLAKSVKSPAIIVGIFITALVFFLFLRPRKSQEFIAKFIIRLGDLLVRFKNEARVFLSGIWRAHPGRLESIFLTILIIFSAIVRLMLINRPIEYDEAFTFTEFARNSFHYIISSYFVPNNQVFHTILVRMAYLVFGDHLWAIRLPTFLASLLLILSVYYLGSSIYNKKVGWVAAVIVAFLPSMVLHSVSARGYVIVTLASLAGFLSANYAIRKKNVLAWISLIVVCAIGFYTVPIMLFPCGLIFAWLFMAGITKEVDDDYGNFANWLKYLLFAGISIGFVVLVLYSPILLTNNLHQIYVNNRVLQPATLSGFIGIIPTMLQDIARDWKRGIPIPIMVLFLLGLFLSFLFQHKYSRYHVPMQIIFIVYIVIMVFIERPAYPFARIWLWAIPLLALWCAVGIVGGLEWVAQKLTIGSIATPVIAVLLFGFAVNGIYQSYDMSFLHPTAEDPVAEKVTLFLKPLLSEDDVVTVSQCSDARYWYYFQHYEIPEDVIRNRDRYFTKDYVIVYTQANPACGNEEMSRVFSAYGPDAAFFDLSTARSVKQIDYATIYELDPILERIKKAYPGN